MTVCAIPPSFAGISPPRVKLPAAGNLADAQHNGSSRFILTFAESRPVAAHFTAAIASISTISPSTASDVTPTSVEAGGSPSGNSSARASRIAE